MRARAASAAGALAVLAACAQPPPPPSSAQAAGREDALRRARVWREPSPPIGRADLGANPPGPDGFGTEEVVPCTFVLAPSAGWSPKFDCALASGEEVKVKYGRKNAEVFGEVAAARLLSVLGFGADRMYVVRGVRCRGCPAYPYPRFAILDALLRDPGREVRFEAAVIERKMPGRAIEDGARKGWTWSELERIDPEAGGSSRAEVDALRLMAVFLNHWDTKGSNQRLVCLAEGQPPAGCARPFALMQDLGQTFGPRGVDLEGWRARPVWADPTGCRVSMKGLPYDGATFVDVEITEGGRRFLGDRLRQLSPAQVKALFAGARFPEYAEHSAAGRDVESWTAAFEDRVRQIADHPSCPR